jgi:hypothetical protein
MNYYVDLDPYLLRERNEGLLREVSTLRLEKSLWEDSEPSVPRLATLARTATLPLLRWVGLAR